MLGAAGRLVAPTALLPVVGKLAPATVVCLAGSQARGLCSAAEHVVLLLPHFPGQLSEPGPRSSVVAAVSPLWVTGSCVICTNEPRAVDGSKRGGCSP